MSMEQLFRECRDLIAKGDFQSLYETEIKKAEKIQLGQGNI